MNIHPRAPPLQPANKEEGGGGMRTLKQEGIPFRIEGDYFLTARQSLSHRFSEWVKPSLSLSLQRPLLDTTREFLVDNRSRRDYKRCQFCSRIAILGRRIFFSPSHLLSGEYFRAGNPFKERYFPSDLFFTGVSRPFFNLPPSRQSVISSLSIEGKRFFYLESVSSPSFLPPRLTLTPMEIIPSPLFFHQNSFQPIPIPYTRISRRVEQQSCRNSENQSLSS